MQVQELFRGLNMAADSSHTLGDRTLGGFLAKASGTISVTFGGTTIVDAVPVTAGLYTPIPLRFNAPGAVVTLASSASGTLFLD